MKFQAGVEKPAKSSSTHLVRRHHHHHPGSMKRFLINISLRFLLSFFHLFSSAAQRRDPLIRIRLFFSHPCSGGFPQHKRAEDSKKRGKSAGRKILLCLRALSSFFHLSLAIHRRPFFLILAEAPQRLKTKARRVALWRYRTCKTRPRDSGAGSEKARTEAKLFLH
jgi:hypothetical protein